MTISWLYSCLIDLDIDSDRVACKLIALLKNIIGTSTGWGKWLCSPVTFILLSFISELIDAVAGQNRVLFFWFAHTKYLNR